MTTYRRILIPLPADGRGETLLRRATEMLPAARGEMMVVRVLDTRSGVEPDGPAANLPGERAARRLPAEKTRLDLQLARHNLSWAESRVLAGEHRTVLAELISTWRPDLVVTCAGPEASIPADELAMDPPDVLAVRCHGVFGRLADALLHAAHGYA